MIMVEVCNARLWRAVELELSPRDGATNRFLRLRHFTLLWLQGTSK